MRRLELTENTVWLFALASLSASLLSLLALLGTIGERPLGWVYLAFAFPAGTFALATLFGLGWARTAAVEAERPEDRRRNRNPRAFR